MWEALQDETLLVLICCAIVSLIVGLTTEVWILISAPPFHFINLRLYYKIILNLL